MTPQQPIEGHGMSPSIGTAKELLARLVAFDTTSHKTNIPLIEFVEAYLAGHGVKSHRVPTAGRTQGQPAGHHSAADGTGGGIVLSGHTDVVPVDGQVWSSDPFTLARSATASSTPAAPAT